MKSEFPTMRLATLAEIQTGPFGSQLHKEDYVSEGTPIVTVEHLGNKNFTEQNLPCVSDKDRDRLKKYSLQEGDIVFSRVGSVDRCSFVSKRYIGWMFSGRCLRVRPRKMLNAEYLYYFFLLESTKQFVRNIATGATMPSINTKFMGEVPVAVPPLDVQEEIVKVLRNLDDKIQLNTEINKNLEAQGLALYKSYFIDFDPYEGTQPKGWNVVSLEDVCLKITDGSHYSPKDDSGAPYPMYSVKDMETYGFNSSSCKHISADEFERMKKSDCVPLVNDILVAKDGSYLKEIFICSEQKDEAVLSSIAIFRPDPNVILPDILLFLLKQPSIRADVADNYVSGSALPRIVLKDFKKYQFILPPIDEQRKIGNILHSIRMQITSNVNENNRLNALRDALLPKLMSGEIDVSDIDF